MRQKHFDENGIFHDESSTGSRIALAVSVKIKIKCKYRERRKRSIK